MGVVCVRIDSSDLWQAKLSNGCEVSLSLSSESVEATYKSGDVIKQLDSIKFGVAQEVPSEKMLKKIRKLEAEFLGLGLYPKENPTELRIFPVENSSTPKAKISAVQKSKSMTNYFLGKRDLDNGRYASAREKLWSSLNELKKAGKVDGKKYEKETKKDWEIIERSYLISYWYESLNNLHFDEIEKNSFYDLINESNKVSSSLNELIECLEISLDAEEDSSLVKTLLRALIFEKKSKYLDAVKEYVKLSEYQPGTHEALRKAYTLFFENELRSAKDFARIYGIRVKFEEFISKIKKKSIAADLECLIWCCAGERDVETWIEDVFSVDLRIAGIIPNIPSIQAPFGTSELELHEEVIKKSRAVVLVCTPQISSYKENQISKKFFELIDQWREEEDRKNFVFTIFAKECGKSHMPLSFKSITAMKLKKMNTDSEFCYFYDAIKLILSIYGNKDNNPREKQKLFLHEVKEILTSEKSDEELRVWQESRKILRKKEALADQGKESDCALGERNKALSTETNLTLIL